MSGRGPSQKSAAQWNEQNSFGRVGVFEKNRTLGFKWCFVYKLVFAWSANFVRFEGKEGFQVKLILFVSLGFCELLRWPLTCMCWYSGLQICNLHKTLWSQLSIYASVIADTNPVTMSCVRSGSKADWFIEDKINYLITIGRGQACPNMSMSKQPDFRNSQKDIWKLESELVLYKGRQRERVVCLG